MTWLPGPAEEPPRVAFALARRVGTAVTRNRLRRQLWHHLAERQRGDAPLRPGAYLISAAAGSARAEPADLRVELDTAIARAVST